jgi:hypothetical protein
LWLVRVEVMPLPAKYSITSLTPTGFNQSISRLEQKATADAEVIPVDEPVEDRDKISALVSDSCRCKKCEAGEMNILRL